MTGPIRETTGERSHDAFVESPSRANKTAVEVYVGNPSDITGAGPFEPPVISDAVTRSVLGPVETYRYYVGGTGGTLLKTITVTYTNASLQDLVKAEVS